MKRKFKLKIYNSVFPIEWKDKIIEETHLQDCYLLKTINKNFYFRLSLDEIEDFWTEVHEFTEEFPKVISFIDQENNIRKIDEINSLEHVLRNNFKIFHVKSSETDSLYLNQKFSRIDKEKVYSIKKFEVIFSKLYYIEEESCELVDIDKIINLFFPENILGFTHDNEFIYYRDVVYLVDDDFNFRKVVVLNELTEDEQYNYKYFKNKDNFEEYLNLYKPKFSLKEIETIINQVVIDNKLISLKEGLSIFNHLELNKLLKQKNEKI